MSKDLLEIELRKKYGDQKMLEWERDREIRNGKYNEDCKLIPKPSGVKQ